MIPLRVAVIGAGYIGREHCLAIRDRVEEMQLVAVCDLSEKDQDVARVFAVPWFHSHHQLIASGLAEAVIVSTPHVSHAEISIDCLSAGLHVLCEKPLTERISTASRMVRTAKAAGMVLGVMFQRRFDPHWANALRVVREGQLGPIHHALLLMRAFRSQAYYDTATWRASWRGEGGGVLMNQAPHLVDLFVQLAGCPTTVCATAQTRLHHIEVEDTASAMVTFANGGTGYVHCTTADSSHGELMEICGDRGKLIWANNKTTFYRYRRPVSAFSKEAECMWDEVEVEDVQLPEAEEETGAFSVMQNFARHIRCGEELRVSGHSALASLELSNAIMLSGWTGRIIALPLSHHDYDQWLLQQQELCSANNTLTEEVFA